MALLAADIVGATMMAVAALRQPHCSVDGFRMVQEASRSGSSMTSSVS
jgi:hypothetical protein